MARLFTSGVELQSGTSGVEFNTTGLGAAGSVDTATFRSGAASMKLAPSAAFSWFGQIVKASANANECFIRVYLYFTAFPGSGTSDVVSAGASGVFSGSIKINSTGELGLYNQSGTQIGSNSSTLSLNQWYMVEMDVKGGASSTGTLKARLEGSEFASSTAVTVSNFDRFWLGTANSTGTYTCYFDDIAINDTSGGSQNSYPGSGKVICLRPNGQGDANSFATQVGGTAGSTNNYTRVNETTPNDATSYNGSSVLNQEDLLATSDSGINSGDTVNVVQVGLRFRNSTADTAATVKAEIEKTSGGTISQSAGITPNSTTWKTNEKTVGDGYPITLYNDPDGNPWTQSTLDSMQIGYKLTTGPATGSRRVDISTVWATVDYTPSTYSPTPDKWSATQSPPIFEPIGIAVI